MHTVFRGSIYKRQSRRHTQTLTSTKKTPQNDGRKSRKNIEISRKKSEMPTE